MSLKPVSEILHQAREKKYGVGYFESWNIESLQAVIDAAEETRSPVIIGFNGEFMSHAERTIPERLNWYGTLGRDAAETAKVPCGFIFNECCQDDWLRRAVTSGFNIIMPSNEKSPDLKKYQAWVGPLTEFAHRHQVAVEAEIGTLPWGDPDGRKELTDPKAAAEFVVATGVDLLAVSAGNVHVLTHGQQELNLEHLAAIIKEVRVPIVLHGGTGISDASLRKAVELGVTKLNFGTNLKRAYIKALGDTLEKGGKDPHHLLGWGGDEDLMVAARRAVRDLVIEKMKVLNCVEKA
jgi:ketose-bisphosphate aldolase